MAPVDIRPPGYIPQGTFSGTIPSASGIAERRKLAQAMMEAGMNASPLRSPWQALARVAQGAAGGLEDYQAGQQEQQRNSALAEALKGNISTADLERLGVQSGDVSLGDVIKYRQTNQDNAKLGLNPIVGTIGDQWVALQPSNQPGQPPQQMQFPPGFQFHPDVTLVDDGMGHKLAVTKKGGIVLGPAAQGGGAAPTAVQPNAGTNQPLDIQMNEPAPQAAPAPAPAQTPAGGIPVATPEQKAQAGQAGRERAKLQFDQPQLEQSLNNSKLWMSNAVKSIDEINAAPGLEYATGHILGNEYVQPFGALASQDVKDTQALVTKLRAQVTQAALQNMRDNSKTGGALGQVSNYEDQLLMNMIGALDMAQGTPQFKGQLDNIKQFMVQSAVNRERAYQQDLQLMGSGASSPGGGVPPPSNPGQRKTKSGVSWGIE